MSISSSARLFRSTATGTCQEEKDEDPKSDTGHNVDLDIAVQKERIMSILDEAIHKSRISVCLEDLVTKRMEELKYAMKEGDFRFIKEKCYIYTDVSDGKVVKEEEIPKLNLVVGRTIYLLAKYPKVGKIVQEIIDSRKNDLNPTPSDIYLCSLMSMRKKIHGDLQIPASEDIKKKIDIRNICRMTEILKQKLIDSRKILQAQRQMHEKELKKRENVVETQSHRLNQLQIDYKDSIKKLLKDSECQMILMKRAHEMRLKSLNEENRDIQLQYKALVNDHILEEKIVKVKRNKTEEELLQWIAKYDKTVGGKQQELDDFNALYDDYVGKVAKIKAELTEQEKLYIPIMAEKQAEYEAEMELKLYKFKLQRSARVIQRMWRRLLEKKAKKRGAKRGKKKKKE